MTKIKLCGLSRPCDMDYVNEANPDFCGFIINYPRSRRSVTPEQVRGLCRNLRREIRAVGVFVDAPLETILSLQDVLSMVQLHGQESEDDIAALRSACALPLIQAFQIRTEADLLRAEASPADHILLDSGQGSGLRFDWSLLRRIRRPYILAGGLTPENLGAAVEQLHPWGVDLSSGIETGGFKDRDKMIAAVNAVRGLSGQK